MTEMEEKILAIILSLNVMGTDNYFTFDNRSHSKDYYLMD